LQQSIQFVFFSGEEQGQWGSRNYAQYLNENKTELHRLINLDMVGFQAMI
jgi:Zn-dependent M28 family amino/carboxypeptidase